MIPGKKQRVYANNYKLISRIKMTIYLHNQPERLPNIVIATRMDPLRITLPLNQLYFKHIPT